MAPSTKAGRVTKSKAKRSSQRRVRTSGRSQQPLIERTNALSIDEFISKYVSPVLETAEQARNHATGQAPLDVYSAASISERDLEACLDLVEQTSAETYEASSGGWSRTKKRKEMKLPDMKYLILRHGRTNPEEAGAERRQNDADNRDQSDGSLGSESVLGFLSFMVTYEDGKEVIYCYEIHLLPTARGRKLGKLLMGHMEQIGRLVGLEKAMLTVFKSNETARRFYNVLGYSVDEYSPEPRRLRNGTIKDVDYVILSKFLK